jgi:hypothetical protein
MTAAIFRVRAAGAYALFFMLVSVTAAGAQTPVTTWHYDNARDGANTNETILTPEKVNTKQFGPLFTQPVDGAIVGQALYLPHIKIPGAGVHNVVYVATMNDSVYAFDADSATGENAAPLWHTSFLINGATAVPTKLQGCGGSTEWTQVGIVSTPVIDPVAKRLYVVAKTYENSEFVYRLHALAVATGLEEADSPVVITASYEVNGRTYVFAPKMQVNRPALTLEKGYLYIAFGSNGCRGDFEEGWVMSYKASTLQPMGAFDDEPGESAAAVWMSGGGLSADSSGNIYGATADGPFTTPGLNLGQSVFKLSQVGSTLELADWFTPFNEQYLDDNDMDLFTSVLVLPTQTGPYPNLVATVGKQGTIYILNQESLGGFCGNTCISDNQIVQELTAVAPFTGSLVYWNNAIYTTATGEPIHVWSLTNGVLESTPLHTANIDSGHSPVISADGTNTTSGILWQLTGSSISAFNATTLKKLYNSGRLSSTLPHFANLVVAHGKVYVGTNTSLVVYGELEN